MVVYSQDYFQKKLEKELETTFVSVEDISDGCDAKFYAIIVTPKFEGVSLSQMVSMVNEVLKEELYSIHSFTLKTLTPEQWEKQKPENKSESQM